LGPGGFGGTSAATPYVAGVVALYLEGKTTYDPNEVEEILKRNATANVLADIGPGSPNLLVYSRVDEWQ
jgi:subtilisin family serine protease